MKFSSNTLAKKNMSEQLEEEVGKAGPSCRTEQEEDDDDTSESGDACHSLIPYHSPFESPQDLLTGPDSSMSEAIGASTTQPNFPTLKVKRPGRPRIHPPKPAGISKPRGRPRGSKNKKPRKRRDPSSLTERPPKRPRGRPRKWPPEMWEGFQRSQFAATQHMQQMQRQQQQQHTQEMLPGPSHLYYEDHMHSHHEDNQSTVPPPLSHLPYMVPQHETQELSHMMQMPPQAAVPQQQQQPPPQHIHLHQTVHPLQRQQHEQQQLMQRQDEQMLLIRPLYMQEQERQLREHELMMSQEQQQRYYHLDGLHHPPHSTS